jgi:hypothetical protein
MAVGAMDSCHVCPIKTVHLGTSPNTLLSFSAAYVLNVALVLYETRCSIILARIAKDIRKATGDPRYRSSFEIDKPSLLSMIKTTLTRPLCASDFFQVYLLED